MHGRQRHRAGEQPFDTRELAQAAELQKLLPVFLHNNRSRCFSKEALQQNAQVLELNPEFNTAWNYRKRCVQCLLEQESEKDARKDIAQNELDLVVRALKVNPKSYGAWNHRKWVIRLGLSSLKAEFVLLTKLLKVDSRNFHGWDFRRFVVKIKGVTAEDELLFTTDKINENFSNYSAWHNRSALLSEISIRETSDSGSIRDRLEEEYELVKNSFFTDPDDQSAWFYHSWLLGQTVATIGTHLNGNWPSANSKISINQNDICSLPTAGKPIEKLGALPLVISFSNPVTGVHSQSVAVKVNGKENLQLDWRPSVPSEKYCLRWTTQIMHQVLLEQLLENGNFTVDILVGASLGIKSPDAQGIDSPSQWSFYVHSEEDTSPAKLDEETCAEGQEGDMTQGVWDILDGELKNCRDFLELLAPIGTYLNASWPSANSKISINQNGICSLPTAGKPIEILGALPLVISFSNPVTGVHSQSVAVKVNGKENLQLDWRPSVPSEKYCLSWTTHIMHQVLLEQLLENGNFTVDILVGASLGIKSLGAQGIDSPSQWSFYVHSEEDSSPAKLEEETCAEGQEGDMTLGYSQGVWQVEILDREIKMCRELLELETNSKWARLTLARLLLAHSSYNTSCCESYRKEAQKHFKELALLDPPHSEYYQHEQSLLLLQELTKDGGSLKKRHQDGKLQFKDCSLSSIAYTERFLWVQHLDLSNNHLRSVHGLDALQLLVCLNLSDNHIGSVAALAPLRDLPQLQDVDVSRNEIGMHPVDSCRFLFPSHLINSCKGARTPLKGGTFWQIEAVFQGLRWRKFIVAGNSVAQDKESLCALREALPNTDVLN